jgi:DNA modification methylase
MQLDDLPQPERIDTVAPDTLEVDGDNPNEQSDEMFGLLCENMRQKGWLGNHIICDTNGLIADGEHRWRAAQEIGLEEVPVKFYDIDDSERRLWRQELNKISGEHDTKRDALEYDYLLDSGKSDAVNDLVNATGEDLDELLQEIKVDTSKPPAYEYDPEHNVYFEDCVEGMRERLDDDSVDCVITDPPYGIDIDGDYGGGTIEGDAELDGALALLEDSMTEAVRVLKPTGHAYVHWSARHIPRAEELLRRLFDDVQVLIWTKNRSNLKAVLENHRYGYNYEVIFYCALDRPRSLNGNVTSNIDVLEHDIVFHEKLGHPTEKPIPLVADLMTNSTNPGDRILDPFMGSGTTAVAAIQNDRDYVGFELDNENYRSVIERRIGEAKRQVAANQD